MKLKKIYGVPLSGAVRLALIGGLEQFITDGGSGIFTSYEGVGRVFPLPENVI